MCGSDGTAMCGEPRVAAECTCTEREFGRCSRPTVRPGRNVNDKRKTPATAPIHPPARPADERLADRDPPFATWQYWPELVQQVEGPAP